MAVIGRAASKLDETISQMTGSGPAVAAGLTDSDAVRTAFASVVAVFGAIDVLVNGAASYSPFPIDRGTDAQIVDVVTRIFIASIYCTREAVKLMRQRGGGDIVNISSQSVETPQPYMSVYAAAKGAVEVLSRGLRYELTGENIRVMVFQLGIVAVGHAESRLGGPKRRIHGGVGAPWTGKGVCPSRLQAREYCGLDCPCGEGSAGYVYKPSGYSWRLARESCARKEREQTATTQSEARISRETAMANSLQDRADIMDLAYSFSDAASRLNGKDLGATFTADGGLGGVAKLVGQPDEDVVGGPKIGEFFGAIFETLQFVHHFSQVVGLKVDGDEATAHCMIREYARPKEGGKLMQVMGTYTDSLMRTADGWRFKRRDLHTKSFTFLGETQP